MKNSNFKQDAYSKNRKNYSEFLNLHCRKCNTHIAKYQKDGPGDLLRIYVDRISDNDDLVNKFEIDRKLICPHCNRILGLGYLYPKEQRSAYILFQGTVTKKPVSYLRHLKCKILGFLR